MMKYIGFLKEYDDLPFSSELKELMTIQQEDNSLIIEYLKRGVACFGWMSYFADNEDKDKLIAPLEYFTDGEWVWTSYFPYYLEKYPHYKVSKEFAEYVRENFNREVQLDEKNLLEIEEEVIKIFE